MALVRANADPTRLLKLIAGGIASATTRSVFAADEDSTLGADWTPKNLSISATRGGSAETIALKDRAGNDFSATNPLILKFRNSTVGTGDYTTVSITAALSITLSNGSTLGTINNVPARLWLVCFNDAGTPRLGLVNCVSGNSILNLKDDEVRSSTAEGGAGAADSAQVIYTGTAVSSKPMRVLGYLEYLTSTVGVWGTAPSKIQLFSPGVPLPGSVVQIAGNATGAFASGTTVIPFDNTIPQSGEGDQYLTQTIVPGSGANMLRVTSFVQLYNSAGSAALIACLFRDSTADALATAYFLPQAGGAQSGGDELTIRHSLLAGAAASTAFKVRAGAHVAGTTSFNGYAAAGIFGGTCASSIQIEEIMT